jgi:hypothetical protein
MTKNTVDFSGWEFLDVLDNAPGPGSFMGDAREFVVNVAGKDITVIANNWFHAEFRAFGQVAEQTGGLLSKCELCGARLRYAALFQGPENSLHIVGRECANRVSAGVENREEWAIALSMKDAKEITTKNGPRWKVDLLEPQGFRMIPYTERPSFVSTWTPKMPAGRGGRVKFGNPRVTIWAKDEAELMNNVRAFRIFLRARKVVVAQPIKKRNF